MGGHDGRGLMQLRRMGMPAEVYETEIRLAAAISLLSSHSEPFVRLCHKVGVIQV